MAKSNKSKVSSFFSDGLSVDETRVSVLMICLLGSLIFGGYIYLVTGAISAVWADLITTLIISVAGINALSTVMEGRKTKATEALSTFLNSDEKKSTDNVTVDDGVRIVEKK